MTDNKPTIDDLLSSVDIVDVISKHGINVIPSGNEFKTLCPFHSERTPSFTITPANQTYYCFGCGAGGNAYNFIKEYNNISGKEAYDKLLEFSGGHITDNKMNDRHKPKPVDDWEPIMPVPDNAPKLMNGGKTNPIFSPNFNSDQIYTPEPDGVYPYRVKGKLVGAVLRIIVNGKKITPAILYCFNKKTGEERWVMRGFPNPKPLYNTDTFIENKPLLIVEGEKCTDAAFNNISHSYNVVSWPNGTNSHDKADWSEIYNYPSSIVLWPDNDIKNFKSGPRKGEIKPVDEQPGRASMIWIKNHLEDNGCTDVTLLDQPTNKTDGWDCADAVEEGIDLIEYIKDHKPSTVRAIEGEIVDNYDENNSVDPNDNKIVKPLGYDGNMFYYYSQQTKQLAALHYKEHTENAMFSLADKSWWESAFQNSKGGFDKSDAAGWMMSSCRLKGIFDPMTIRGRGCWMDDGRFVIHLGDRLIVDGQTVSISDIKSKYVYQAAKRIPAPQNALDDESAKAILETAKSFDWEMPASGALLAGYCVLAPMCSSLEWRPHIWITGLSGSGKSAVVENFVSPTLGDMGMLTSLNSTEAGVRRTLKYDGMPVVVEEFDPRNKVTQDKAQSYFDLMRISSNNNGVKVYRASMGEGSTAFEANSMFCLVGIQICTNETAILNRTAKLTLKSKRGLKENEAAENWNRIKSLLDKNILGVDNISSRLFARTVGMIGTIQHNIKIFRSAAHKYFGSARHADQYGTLLAGAYSLVSDCKLKEETALHYIESFDWDTYTEDSDVDESGQCLSSILQIQLMVNSGTGPTVKTIGEWIDMCRTEIDGVADIDSALRRCGIRCDKNCIKIANKSEYLQSMLKDKEWGINWSRYLVRINEYADIKPSRSKNAVTFQPGFQSRATIIPYELLGLNNEQEESDSNGF